MCGKNSAIFSFSLNTMLNVYIKVYFISYHDSICLLSHLTMATMFVKNKYYILSMNYDVIPGEA